MKVIFLLWLPIAKTLKTRNPCFSLPSPFLLHILLFKCPPSLWWLKMESILDKTEKLVSFLVHTSPGPLYWLPRLWPHHQSPDPCKPSHTLSHPIPRDLYWIPEAQIWACHCGTSCPQLWLPLSDLSLAPTSLSSAQSHHHCLSATQILYKGLRTTHIYSVMGWLMPPSQRCPHSIPRTWNMLLYMSRGCFTEVSKSRILRWRDFLGSSECPQGYHKGSIRTFL